MVSAAEIAETLQQRCFHVDQIGGRIVGRLPDEDLQVLVHPACGGFGWDMLWKRPGVRLLLYVWLPSDLTAAVERDVPDWLSRPLPRRRDGGE